MDGECCCCSVDGIEPEIDASKASAQSRDSVAETSCPSCGERGRPVRRETLKTMLVVSLRRVPDGEFLFCDSQQCSAVYFSRESRYSFEVDDMREHVYQKEPAEADTLVCYCFQHSVGAFQSASSEERAAIADDITLGTKIGQCACELRNPQGSCCLGNVHGLIRRLDAVRT
jgi:hypothetical protein